LKSKVQDLFRKRIEKRIKEEAAKEKSRPYFYAVGATMPDNMLFVDVDSLNFDIYCTRDGFHVVTKLRRKFDYHFKRIRISPKFSKKGRVVNPEPKLIFCHCPKQHREKRLKGKLQVYKTYSE
jgi:hypothetical protein